MLAKTIRYPLALYTFVCFLCFLSAFLATHFRHTQLHTLTPRKKINVHLPPVPSVPYKAEVLDQSSLSSALELTAKIRD